MRLDFELFLTVLNKCGRISTRIKTKDAANDLITAKHYSGMGRIALVRIVFATFSCFRVHGFHGHS